MGESTEHRIEVHLNELVAARDMTLVELSAKVGVTVANLSILKNGHARAVRFTTLTAICDVLGCSPGELLSLRDEPYSPSLVAAEATPVRLGNCSDIKVPFEDAGRTGRTSSISPSP